MRKILFTLTLLVAFLPLRAAYYVAGNGTAGNPWCDGKSWTANGSLMAQDNGLATLTFTGVPAGSYQFKITTGTWNTNYGFSRYDLDCSTIQAAGNADGNVCFSTTEAQAITITFDGSRICLTGDGHNELDTAHTRYTGVPTESEAVMLQAFYWDSYTLTTFGRTKWQNLLQDTTYLCRNFDYVWFPPSARSSNTGVGYDPAQWSNQTNTWGTKTDLLLLIEALHRGGSKAIADIVINHKGNRSNWCDFYKEDFGELGTYQFTAEHICSTDECFTQSASSCYGSATHGAPDTGDDFSGIRDLDHTSPYVQEAVTAYLQWLLTEMHYDGFRYDMVKGYLPTYLSQYNVATTPELSVAEYWDGIDAIKGYLQGAKYNTMAFDFPLKYVLRDNIGKGVYTGLRNPANSLRAKGLAKYAVTFIDNHDTFGRSESAGNALLGASTDLKSAANAPKVLQANAYILMMPGIPCVFWPHWHAFPSEIHKFISIRKAAGLHSESEVTDEQAGTGYYHATIHGHRGMVILRLGDKRDTTAPVGFHLATEGKGYSIFLQDGITALEDLPLEPTHSARKLLIDGQLFIEKDGRRYDATGQEVR